MVPFKFPKVSFRGTCKMTVYALSNDIYCTKLLSVIQYHHNGRYELHVEHFDLIIS